MFLMVMALMCQVEAREALKGDASKQERIKEFASKIPKPQVVVRVQ